MRPLTFAYGFAGATISPSDGSPTWVGAQIEQYHPFIYNSSFAWVMLTAFNHRYAQAGWAVTNPYSWNYQNGCGARCTFSQYSNGGDWYSTFHPARPLGEMTYYEVRVEPCFGPIAYAYYVNGSRFGCNGLEFNSIEVQVLGETHDQADQMPGGASSRLDFDFAKYASGPYGTIKNLNSPQPAEFRRSYNGSEPSSYYASNPFWDPKWHLGIGDNACVS